MIDWGRPFYVQPDGRPVYLVRVQGAQASCPAIPIIIEGHEWIGCDLTRGKGTDYHAEYWRSIQGEADGQAERQE